MIHRNTFHFHVIVLFIFHLELIATDGNYNDRCGKASKLYSRTAGIGNQMALNRGDFPWHATIYDNTNMDIPICGASIISHHLLVSAAHCFYDRIHERRRNATDYRVVVNELENRAMRNSTEKNAHTYYIEDIIYNFYDDEKSAFQIDVALLVTKKLINFTKNISPICLVNDLGVYENQEMDIPGWESSRTEKVTYLRSIHLPYVSYNTCSQSAPETIKSILSNDKFCVGGVNVDLLKLVLSGGGLVIRNRFLNTYQLVGIMSIKLNDVPYLALATSIEFVHAWIEEQKNEILKRKKNME